MNLPAIVALCGPSAAGKSTLIDALLEKHPGTFFRMVGTTTREKRPSERDGVDYHFVDSERFERLKGEGAFFDSISTPGGEFGSPRPYTSSETQEKILLYNLSLSGALELLEHYPSSRLFYLSISRETQRSRLQERHTSLAEIDARTAPFEAEAELIAAHEGTVVVLNANHPEDIAKNVEKVGELLGL